MTPSTTMRGSLFPWSELPPRTRMRSSEPGCELVVCTWTPDTSPEIASSTRGTGIVAMSAAFTDDTDPVTSRLFWVPYPTVTTRSSENAVADNEQSALDGWPAVTVTDSSLGTYPMRVARTW